MTCIVGLIHKKKVYIGGDSAGTAGLALTIRKDPKVFKVGKFLIGYTSSFRMGQLLRFNLNPPAHYPDMDVLKYMVTSFIDKVRQCLKGGGYAAKKDEVEQGGVFLIGYKGRLFKISGDYQVGEAIDHYEAAGCGEDIAYGSLFSSSKMKPRERIRIALEAAEHHSAGVRAPFIIQSI